MSLTNNFSTMMVNFPTKFLLLLCLPFLPSSHAWAPTSATNPRPSLAKNGGVVKEAVMFSHHHHNAAAFAVPSPPSVVDRRAAVVRGAAALVVVPSLPASCAAAGSGLRVDVNNAVAREFTAFPGLYPTVATKIVTAAKREPFKTKKDVYAILSDAERDRLRQYDASIVVNKPDRAIQQFKASQICKYECGGRASSGYRDGQIREVQRQR